MPKMSKSDVKIGDIVTISVTGKVRDTGTYGFNMTGRSGEAVVARFDDVDDFKIHKVFTVGQRITNASELVALPIKTVIVNSANWVYQKVDEDRWQGGSNNGRFAAQDFASRDDWTIPRGTELSILALPKDVPWL